MSIREQLFTSFIKGIGKTSGTVTVFGFLGAAWYFYNKSTNYSLTKLFKNKKIILQELDEVDEVDEVEESESEQQTQQESEAIQESVLEKDKLKISKSNTSQNFRRIFDSL
jgi:hypothetical protein